VTLTRLGLLRGLLVLWVLWHLAFGLLASFAPEAGARAVGWRASGGWEPELVAMSTQYGMVMILLAGVYGIMALDPLRYLDLLWIAVAEQALGIVYAGYLFTSFGELGVLQLLLQTLVNIALIAVLVRLGSAVREEAREVVAP